MRAKVAQLHCQRLFYINFAIHHLITRPRCSPPTLKDTDCHSTAHSRELFRSQAWSLWIFTAGRKEAVSGFQQRRLRCRWFLRPLLALLASKSNQGKSFTSLPLLGAYPAVESYTLHQAATKMRMWFTNDVSSYSGGPYRARCSSIGPLWSLIWRTKSSSTWGTPARYVTRTRNMPVALPSAASVFRLERSFTRITQLSCIQTGAPSRGERAALCDLEHARCNPECRQCRLPGGNRYKTGSRLVCQTGAQSRQERGALEPI